MHGTVRIRNTPCTSCFHSHSGPIALIATNEQQKGLQLPYGMYGTDVLPGVYSDCVVIKGPMRSFCVVFIIPIGSSFFTVLVQHVGSNTGLAVSFI